MRSGGRACAAPGMLARGGSWVVIETPNRLWYFDGHTALLPFYHWLPDRLAFEYARFSPREYFREVYSEFTPDKALHFLRRGRGVSFHEFDLFIAPDDGVERDQLPAYLRAGSRRHGAARLGGLRLRRFRRSSSEGVPQGSFSFF